MSSDNIRKTINMNRNIIIYSLVVALTGCGARYKDHSNLNITPGVGIKGVIEIGMSIDDVRRNTRDLAVYDTSSPVSEYQVPSLGLSWQSGGICSNNPLGVFIMFVGASEVVKGKASVSRFSGWLENTLSFTNGNLVTEKQIMQMFGEPELKFDMNTFPTNNLNQAYASLLAVCRTNMQSKAILWPNSAKQIYYPQKGIFFFSVSNTVNAVGIQKVVDADR